MQGPQESGVEHVFVLVDLLELRGAEGWDEQQLSHDVS